MDIRTSTIPHVVTKQSGEVVASAALPTHEKKKQEAVAPISSLEKGELLAKEVEKAIEKTNQMLSERSTGLEFSLDEDSGRTIVKLIDKETAEILRQYPTEEMISISKAIDKFQGALVSEKI